MITYEQEALIMRAIEEDVNEHTYPKHETEKLYRDYLSEKELLEPAINSLLEYLEIYYTQGAESARAFSVERTQRKKELARLAALEAKKRVLGDSANVN